MNILPQNYTEFKDKKYWDHFFSALKNTENEFFEWYGAYSDYKHLLHDLICPTSTIFHVGCGKSTFSEDLLKESPKLTITNCDYSEDVIKSMRERTEKNKINMDYVVCDLLEPLQQNFCNKFDVVLDKGTLDAMLPEDGVAGVAKMKQLYFANAQKSLREKGQVKGKFIIISLLQPFVLRTIIEHYAFQPQKYQVDIYECLIKDSKLQPFLVCITFNPSEKEKLVRFHPLSKKQVTRWGSLQQTLKGIEIVQKQVTHGGRIKQLFPGRRTKFNIYSQKNRKDIRYLIEVIDSERKEILEKNTCSIFIVPQGKQTGYHYNDQSGIKLLHSQVNSSRLILVKLVAGGEFNNLDQVKNQLNLVMSDFVQNGCDPNKAPYLTDADQLGQRKYLFQNEEVILDEVLVEGDPIRRLFLRSAPTVPQCQFKLTYLSEANNKQLKQFGSKILPVKKNMVTGIDKQQLFDDSARFIYSGLTAFLGNSQPNWKVLILGCQFALAKFLSDVHQDVEVTVLCGHSKSVKAIALKYLEMEQSENLRIIPMSATQYLNSNPEQKFNIIVQCTYEKNDGPNPPLAQVSSPFQLKLVQLFENPGLYVCQYRNYEAVPNFGENFFPVYGSQSSSKQQNILFCLRHNKKYTNDKLVVHQNLIKLKPKNKPRFEWEEDNIKDIGLIVPSIVLSQQKELVYDGDKIYIEREAVFEDIYRNQEKSDKKGSKKKKKKR